MVYFRAITGVYNVMFRTSLPARASFTETAVLLVRDLGSSCWFGPAMDIDTHIGATLRADTFSMCTNISSQIGVHGTTLLSVFDKLNARLYSGVFLGGFRTSNPALRFIAVL